MGFEVKETLTGNDAICFCHEFDHLNGKLIID
jgi:peptide deformylase